MESEGANVTRRGVVRWSVYGVGLAACVGAMVVLAGESGFDPVVGLCGAVAIAGAVLATWAMTNGGRRMAETCFGVLAVSTRPGEVAPGAMVGLRVVKVCPVHGTHVIADQFIEPHEARTMGQRLCEMAAEADAENERHALGETPKADVETE